MQAPLRSGVTFIPLISVARRRQSLLPEAIAKRIAAKGPPLLSESRRACFSSTRLGEQYATLVVRRPDLHRSFEGLDGSIVAAK